MTKVFMTRDVVRELSGAYLQKCISTARTIGMKSFTLPELPGVGSNWPPVLGPFYDFYAVGKETEQKAYKTAAAELGRVLAKEAKLLGLYSQQESRNRGAIKTITRYFFEEPKTET